MKRYKISWWLYIVGSLLVFGSWVNIVPAALGWCGWLMALGGWALSNAPRRQAVARSKANEIAKMDLLRKEGVVTEEEFQQEKARILQES
jgi:hypothetical protein